MEEKMGYLWGELYPVEKSLIAICVFGWMGCQILS